MKRLLGILLNALAALSLLLSLASVVLWVRSYWIGDFAYWRPTATDSMVYDWRFELRSRRGVLTIERCAIHNGRIVRDPSDPRTWRAWSTWRIANEQFASEGVLRELWHFRAQHRAAPLGSGFQTEITTLAVPYWFWCLLLLMTPALRLRAARRRGRPGFCAACGYDLRATPDRCPECGTITERGT